MSVLENEDLRAVPASGRGWTTWNYAALWIGMSVCIPTYQLASSLMTDPQNGPPRHMNWWEAILTIALGNLIVLLPMIANGHAGAKYGIPFPVFARASFGLKGANVPAMLRAVVACGWFGIQTWIGGAALAVVFAKAGIWQTDKTAWLNDVLGLHATGEVKTLDYIMESGQHLALPTGEVALSGLAAALHVRSGVFACFVLFWLVNMAIVWAGIESIRKLLVFKSFFLPAATFGLLAWAYIAAGGLGPMLDRPSSFGTTGEFMSFFIPSLTGAIGFWATLSLNIPDFTRYAKGQAEQIKGQAIGLPLSMTAVSFVGVAVTSATTVIPGFGGKAEWNPVEVVNHFSSPLLVGFAMFCVVLSTLATNIAANIVSPANDFSNLSPSKISFRTGGFITGLVGICMFPWKLLEDPTGYVFTWLIGYSALLGPIGGILITDYFLVRRTALDVKDLYHTGGRYDYTNGWNRAAILALLLGVLPSIPGFVITVAPSNAKHFPEWLLTIVQWEYNLAWIVGFVVAAVVYRVAMKAQGSDAMTHGVKV